MQTIWQCDPHPENPHWSGPCYPHPSRFIYTSFLPNHWRKSERNKACTWSIKVGLNGQQTAVTLPQWFLVILGKKLLAINICLHIPYNKTKQHSVSWIINWMVPLHAPVSYFCSVEDLLRARFIRDISCYILLCFWGGAQSTVAVQCFKPETKNILRGLNFWRKCE